MDYFASKNTTSIIKRFLVRHVTEICCGIGIFCRKWSDIQAEKIGLYTLIRNYDFIKPSLIKVQQVKVKIINLNNNYKIQEVA